MVNLLKLAANFCKLSKYVQVSHTNGKQFNPSILQTLCGGNHIVLRLPVCDEDSYFWDTRSGARFWFETVLQDKGQSQTWTQNIRAESHSYITTQ